MVLLGSRDDGVERCPVERGTLATHPAGGQPERRSEAHLAVPLRTVPAPVPTSIQ